MMTLEDRYELDNPRDQSGFKLARSGLAVVFPLVPGLKTDPLSFELAPHVQCVGALVGEEIALRLTMRGFNVQHDLLRKPEGSAAAFAACKIKLDLPGVYCCRVWLGGWHRDVAIGVWPLAALYRLGREPAPGKGDLHYFERRERLQGICSDRRVTAATMTEAIEVNSSGCFGFDGTIFGGPHQGAISTNW